MTHEVPSEATRKTKIRNACIELGLTCIGPYDMLRCQCARVVLAPSVEIA